MRLLFVCFILSLCHNAMANDAKTDLKNIARSLDIMEKHQSKIDDKIANIQGDIDKSQNSLEATKYNMARNLYHYNKLNNAPTHMAFLIPDGHSHFLNHYYDLRYTKYLKQFLSDKFDGYSNTIEGLKNKTDEIQSYMREKENLSIEIATLMQALNNSESSTADLAFIKKLEDIKSRHHDLNNFLGGLGDFPNMIFTAKKPPSFIIPVSGVITNQTSNILINAVKNAPVKTPAAGRVLHAGIFKNLGNIIIIDHGYKFISILRGFKDIRTETGAILDNHDIIGTIGGDEWAKDKNKSILYYQLRYNNQIIDPITQITGL